MVGEAGSNGLRCESRRSAFVLKVSHAFALEPWGCGTVLKKFAGPDESDYNLHLSNSSYPKARPQLVHSLSTA